jgi:predicted nucleotidyltransferase
MTEIKNTVTLQAIREIVQQIVERFRPQKVILFGSYAHGKPTSDTDVDLLVVMETSEQALHAAARISAAIDHPFPLDILVFRPSELKASLQRKGVFATEVMAKGLSCMKPETTEWIDKAEGDWTVAQREMRAANPVWNVVSFLPQQCDAPTAMNVTGRSHWFLVEKPNAMRRGAANEV